jgi:hypothetical protein
MALSVVPAYWTMFSADPLFQEESRIIAEKTFSVDYREKVWIFLTNPAVYSDANLPFVRVVLLFLLV